jgi:hypothetical protein
MIAPAGTEKNKLLKVSGWLGNRRARLSEHLVDKSSREVHIVPVLGDVFRPKEISIQVLLLHTLICV